MLDQEILIPISNRHSLTASYTIKPVRKSPASEYLGPSPVESQIPALEERGSVSQLWFRAQPSEIDERIIQARLRQAGVPIDELQERLPRLDMSVRGTPEELRQVDAQIMEDLAPARAAANRLELGD